MEPFSGRYISHQPSQYFVQGGIAGAYCSKLRVESLKFMRV